MEAKLTSPQDNSKLSAPMIKLQSTVTLYDVVELQIEPNSYYKYTDKLLGDYYYHVKDENTVTQVQKDPTYVGIVKCSIQPYASKLAQAKPITEGEYINALLDAVAILPLPKSLLAASLINEEYKEVAL